MKNTGTMESTAEKTKRIIADTLGVEKEALTDNTHLVKDLGADSLDVVDLVTILEKEFKISVPDEKMERMDRVSHFVDYFEKTRVFPMVA
jgi:acyl carrier protein